MQEISRKNLKNRRIAYIGAPFAPTYCNILRPLGGCARSEVYGERVAFLKESSAKNFIHEIYYGKVNACAESSERHIRACSMAPHHYAGLGYCNRLCGAKKRTPSHNRLMPTTPKNHRHTSRRNGAGPCRRREFCALKSTYFHRLSGVPFPCIKFFAQLSFKKARNSYMQTISHSFPL